VIIIGTSFELMRVIKTAAEVCFLQFKQEGFPL